MPTSSALWLSALCSVALLVAVTSARAGDAALPSDSASRDQILISEVVPALTGSPTGMIVIANAPASGSVLVVRRADVLRVLKAAGVSTQGLAIPSATRISRKELTLTRAQLADLAGEALSTAAAPCVVGEVSVQAEAHVAAGARSVSVELARPSRSGRVGAGLVIEAGGHRTRVPMTTAQLCPEPELIPGKSITLVSVVGLVRASAAGEAKQLGRVGDVIRVQNRTTGAALQARILDSQTAEVVQ